MKVRALYTPDVVQVDPADSLRVAAATMRDLVVGSVLAFEEDRLVGILTEQDLARAVAAGVDPDRALVDEWMSRNPVCVEPEADSADVAARMLELGLRHLPVWEEGRVIGMVSSRDLLEADAWPILHGRRADEPA